MNWMRHDLLYWPDNEGGMPRLEYGYLDEQKGDIQFRFRYGMTYLPVNSTSKGRYVDYAYPKTGNPT